MLLLPGTLTANAVAVGAGAVYADAVDPLVWFGFSCYDCCCCCWNVAANAVAVDAGASYADAVCVADVCCCCRCWYCICRSSGSFNFGCCCCDWPGCECCCCWFCTYWYMPMLWMLLL